MSSLQHRGVALGCLPWPYQALGVLQRHVKSATQGSSARLPTLALSGAQCVKLVVQFDAYQVSVGREDLAQWGPSLHEV